MSGTTFAASVTIIDLPVGTTVTGAELFEAVQTSSGVGQSVQLTLNQMAAFTTLNSFVKTVGTGLATSGTVTAIVAFVATAGIGSTQLGALAVQSSNLTTGAVGSTQLGAFAVVAGAIATSAVGSTQLGALAVQQANITAAAVGSTQIANNAIGTNQLASSLGIATSLSIGGLLTVGGTATITGTAILNGGLQVAGPITATGKQTLLNATGLATVGTAVLLVSSVASFGMYCGTGAPSVSAGTGSIYLRNDGTTATTRMYININGTGTWTGVTTVA